MKEDFIERIQSFKKNATLLKKSFGIWADRKDVKNSIEHVLT